MSILGWIRDLMFKRESQDLNINVRVRDSKTLLGRCPTIAGAVVFQPNIVYVSSVRPIFTDC